MKRVSQLSFGYYPQPLPTSNPTPNTSCDGELDLVILGGTTCFSINTPYHYRQGRMHSNRSEQTGCVANCLYCLQHCNSIQQAANRQLFDDAVAGDGQVLPSVEHCSLTPGFLHCYKSLLRSVFNCYIITPFFHYQRFLWLD